jgi:hypothetical protein
MHIDPYRDRGDDQEQDTAVRQWLLDIDTKGQESECRKQNSNGDAEPDETNGERVFGDIKFGCKFVSESEPQDVPRKQLERNDEHEAGKREWVEVALFHDAVSLGPVSRGRARESRLHPLNRFLSSSPNGKV